MLNKILVAFDGSLQSEKAFEYALELSGLLPVGMPEVTVISVAQPPEPIDIIKMEEAVDNATVHYEGLFQVLRELARQKHLDLATHVAVGHPADQIVKYAAENNFDMIVMGQRGKSMIESWLLGSVSRRVAAHAPCTVTIVK